MRSTGICSGSGRRSSSSRRLRCSSPPSRPGRKSDRARWSPSIDARPAASLGSGRRWGPPVTIEAPLWWEDGALCLLDQTRLPHEVRTVRCTSWEEVAEAIRGLRVRGAPAIGLAAAYGLVLAAATDAGTLRQAAAGLRAARPTAVNLAWAIDQMLRVAEGSEDPAALPRRLLEAADALARADVDTNRRIGEHGAALIPHGARVLTYCHTGLLATAD